MAAVNRPERSDVLDLLRRVRASTIGERLILGGSSGVYGASETLPALTEDVDVLVDANWVAAHESTLLEQMRELGFGHQAGTCTFIDSEGMSIDLVGYSLRDTEDRIGGSDRVPVMVYGDLSRLLATPGSTVELAGGGRALSPAALAMAKLLTIRLEKGSKDKLQALLIIEENAAKEEFLASFRRLLRTSSPDRIEDAVADAQAASLAVSGDVALAGPQAAGYAEMHLAVARGLAILQQVTGQGGTK
jgi:hypothetical protein